MTGSKSPITSKDGGDHDYRMRVDNVYADMAKMRRNLKISTKVQTIYILARSAWKFIPSFITGSPLAITDVLILLVGIALFLCYRYAFGYGKAQHEKLPAIMACTIGNMLLMAECFLTFWLYHINFGPKSIYPEAAAAYPPIPRLLIAVAGLKGGTAESVLTVLDLIEKGVDVVGIGSLLITVVVMREYAMESKELKKEQQKRREEGLKAE